MSEGTDEIRVVDQLAGLLEDRSWGTQLLNRQLIARLVSEDRSPSEQEWSRAIEFQRLKFIRQVVVATTRNMNLTDINDFPSVSAMVTEAATKAWELHAAPRAGSSEALAKEEEVP